MAGLDPESRRYILELIRHLRGISTIVITTHAMEDVEAVASTLVI